MDCLTKRTVLSVVDRRLSDYPLCIVDEVEFMGRLKLSTFPGHSAVDQEKFPGDLIRQITVAQLSSTLALLKSTSADNLAVRRGSFQLISNTNESASVLNENPREKKEDDIETCDGSPKVLPSTFHGPKEPIQPNGRVQPSEPDFKDVGLLEHKYSYKVTKEIDVMSPDVRIDFNCPVTASSEHQQTEGKHETEDQQTFIQADTDADKEEKRKKKFAKAQTLHKNLLAHASRDCEQFKRVGDVKRHKCSGSRGPLKCSECDEVFFKKSVFKKHMFKKHIPSHDMQRNPEVKKSSKFACTECDRTFTSNFPLVIHQRSHSGEKPFPCDVCGKRFSAQGSLIAHNRIHTGEKPFLCSTCGKAFGLKKTMQDHELIHTGVKSHVCDTCGKAFTLKKLLQRHKLTHGGVKKYMCEECGRAFLRKKNLTEHLRIHAGIKPYVCQYCGHKFTKHYPLTYHLKTKHKHEMSQMTC